MLEVEESSQRSKIIENKIKKSQVDQNKLLILILI